MVFIYRDRPITCTASIPIAIIKKTETTTGTLRNSAYIPFKLI